MAIADTLEESKVLYNLLTFGLPCVIFFVLSLQHIARLRGDFSVMGRWLVLQRYPFTMIPEDLATFAAPTFAIMMFYVLLPMIILVCWFAAALAHSEYLYAWTVLFVGLATICATWGVIRWFHHGMTLTTTPKLMLGLSCLLLCAFQLVGVLSVETRTYVGISFVCLALNMMPVTYMINLIISGELKSYRDYATEAMPITLREALKTHFRTLVYLSKNQHGTVSEEDEKEEAGLTDEQIIEKRLKGEAPENITLDQVFSKLPQIREKLQQEEPKRLKRVMIKVALGSLLSLAILWAYAGLVAETVNYNGRTGASSAGYATAAAVVILDITVCLCAYAGRLKDPVMINISMVVGRIFTVIFGDQYYFVGHSFMFLVLFLFFAKGVVDSYFPPVTPYDAVRRSLEDLQDLEKEQAKQEKSAVTGTSEARPEEVISTAAAENAANTESKEDHVIDLGAGKVAEPSRDALEVRKKTLFSLSFSQVQEALYEKFDLIVASLLLTAFTVDIILAGILELPKVELERSHSQYIVGLASLFISLLILLGYATIRTHVLHGFNWRALAGMVVFNIVAIGGGICFYFLTDSTIVITLACILPVTLTSWLVLYRNIDRNKGTVFAAPELRNPPCVSAWSGFWHGSLTVRDYITFTAMLLAVLAPIAGSLALTFTLDRLWKAWFITVALLVLPTTIYPFQQYFATLTATPVIIGSSIFSAAVLALGVIFYYTINTGSVESELWPVLTCIGYVCLIIMLFVYRDYNLRNKLTKLTLGLLIFAYMLLSAGTVALAVKTSPWYIGGGLFVLVQLAAIFPVFYFVIRPMLVARFPNVTYFALQVVTALLLGFALFIGLYEGKGFVGFSISWGVLFVWLGLALYREVGGRSMANSGVDDEVVSGYSVSSAIFPIFEYVPKASDAASFPMRLNNARGLIPLAMCGMLYFWGIVAAFFISPSSVGSSISALALTLTTMLAFNLARYTDLKYANAVRFLGGETSELYLSQVYRAQISAICAHLPILRFIEAHALASDPKLLDEAPSTASPTAYTKMRRPPTHALVASATKPIMVYPEVKGKGQTRFTFGSTNEKNASEPQEQSQPQEPVIPVFTLGYLHRPALSPRKLERVQASVARENEEAVTPGEVIEERLKSAYAIMYDRLTRASRRIIEDSKLGVKTKQTLALHMDIMDSTNGMTAEDILSQLDTVKIEQEIQTLRSSLRSPPLCFACCKPSIEAHRARMEQEAAYPRLMDNELNDIESGRLSPTVRPRRDVKSLSDKQVLRDYLNHCVTYQDIDISRLQAYALYHQLETDFDQVALAERSYQAQVMIEVIKAVEHLEQQTNAITATILRGMLPDALKDELNVDLIAKLRSLPQFRSQLQRYYDRYIADEMKRRREDIRLELVRQREEKRKHEEEERRRREAEERIKEAERKFNEELASDPEKFLSEEDKVRYRQLVTELKELEKSHQAEAYELKVAEIKKFIQEALQSASDDVCLGSRKKLQVLYTCRLCNKEVCTLCRRTLHFGHGPFDGPAKKYAGCDTHDYATEWKEVQEDMAAVEREMRVLYTNMPKDPLKHKQSLEQAKAILEQARGKLHAVEKISKSAPKQVPFRDPDFPYEESYPADDFPPLNPADYELIILPVEPFEIIQGGLGDCYLVAALAVTTQRPTLFLRALVTEVQTVPGMYTVRFMLGDRAEYVTVDAAGAQYRALAHSRQSNELYPYIVERAYAKLFGGYSKIEGSYVSTALAHLTGGLPAMVPINRDRPDLDGIVQLIRREMERGSLMGAGSISREGSTHDDKINGIAMGHAYSILDCRSITDSRGNQVWLVQLRNPWGDVEWTGDWSDSSPCWTPALRKLLDVAESPDGVFWMSVNDFAMHFRTIYICRFPSMQKFPVHIRERIILEASPTSTYVQAQRNHQFKIVCEEQTTVVLSQVPVVRRNTLLKSEYYLICLMKPTKPCDYITLQTPGVFILNAKVNTLANSNELVLEPGEYNLLVASPDSSTRVDVVLDVYASSSKFKFARMPALTTYPVHMAVDPPKITTAATWADATQVLLRVKKANVAATFIAVQCTLSLVRIKNGGHEAQVARLLENQKDKVYEMAKTFTSKDSPLTHVFDKPGCYVVICKTIEALLPAFDVFSESSDISIGQL